MKIKVSELVVRYMERLGIDTLFGMPGAHILPVYDQLYDSSIDSVLVKHEQGAAFMAGGYARVSGRIGACISTAGPGATNLVTGIANAHADKQPVLVVTGEAPTYIFGKGGLQESSGEGGSIDQNKLFDGISRYHRIIERTDYLPNVLNHASSILFAETSGPVVLSLPFNIQNESVDDCILDEVKTHNRIGHCHHRPPDIDRLHALLAAARHPVMVCGYGCLQARAQAQVKQLSEQLNIPVTSSLKGKGSLDENAALSLGSLGVTSSGFAHDYILKHADLILILGAGFNERTSYLWNRELLKGKRLVQVDLNEAQLEKVYQADLAIHGDIRATLQNLLDRLAQDPLPAKDTAVDIPTFKLNCATAAEKKGQRIFNSEFALIEAFYQRLNQRLDNAAIFDDNIIFAQNFLQVKDGIRYHPNSGISSLGHAIPAAIGAQFAERGCCFAILGDGGFQMCCMELMTAVNYGIPLNVVIFNNQTMGLIRKNQTQTYAGRFINCDFDNPDYRLLAQAFGIHYYHLADEGQIDAFFDQADLREGINLIELPLDRDAFPNYRSRR